MTPPPFVPGIFPDMPAETYHAVECMSSGGLKQILKTPQHFRMYRDKQRTTTDYMDFGTGVHYGVLEPQRWLSDVIRAPMVNKRTNAGKAELAEFEAVHIGKLILSDEDYRRALRCIDAVRSHPMASKLLAGAEIEISMFWNDAEYGVPCKCRWDARNHGMTIDLKTSVDASPEAFARTAANMFYHVQAAHYMSGGEHVLNETPDAFINIVAESEEPHGVAVYEMPSAAIRMGRHLADEGLSRYRAAMAANAWVGYPETIQPLPFPRWALRV